MKYWIVGWVIRYYIMFLIERKKDLEEVIRSDEIYVCLKVFIVEGNWFDNYLVRGEMVKGIFGGENLLKKFIYLFWRWLRLGWVY